MTGRQRFCSAVDGEPVDRKPRVALTGRFGSSDVLVISSSSPQIPGDDRAILVGIDNPFGKSKDAGINLNSLMKENPETGASTLAHFVAACRNEISNGIEGGADGILYRLHGASPEDCSPMQYGGYYLEADRALLTLACEAKTTVLLLMARDRPYVDFVSDLPAQVFAWLAPDVPSAEVRLLRAGVQLSADSESEMDIMPAVALTTEFLESPTLGQAV